MRLIQKAELVDTKNKTKYIWNFSIFCPICLFFEIVEVERQLMIFCVLNKLAQPFIHFKTKNIKNPKNHRNRGFLCAKNLWFLLSNCECKSEEQIFVKVRGFVPRFCLGSRSLLLQPLTKRESLSRLLLTNGTLCGQKEIGETLD